MHHRPPLKEKRRKEKLQLGRLNQSPRVNSQNRHHRQPFLLHITYYFAHLSNLQAQSCSVGCYTSSRQLDTWEKINKKKKTHTNKNQSFSFDCAASCHADRVER